VINIAAPAAILSGTTDLARIGALVFPSRQAAPLELAPLPTIVRSELQARRTLTTVTSPDAPQVRAHVVTTGETLLSIASRFGVAPQTIAYDNGISDSAQLKVGASLVIPPFDAAIHVMAAGETVASVAERFGLDADAVRAVNRIAPDDGDATEGRALLIPVLDARYPGFRLHLSDPPRVLAPRVGWPVDGVITQLFSLAHTGVDIAAPYGTPIVASDAGTVSFVGWRGDGGLAVCVRADWGLETCAYHDSATYVEVGDRVDAGQRIAAIGTTGVTTGPHVHWEARTNGALVDPLTYAAYAGRPPAVGGATGSP
jgi:murein DD-endopeptidase MepM/ murein hydrolase activator NlpD